MRAPDPTWKTRVVPVTPGVILPGGGARFLLLEQPASAALRDEKEQAARKKRQGGRAGSCLGCIVADK